MFNIFNKTPKKFIAHILDAQRGYYTSEVVPDSDTDAKRLAQMAEGDKLYFITHYEEGNPVQSLVDASKKQIWLDLKNAQF